MLKELLFIIFLPTLIFAQDTLRYVPKIDGQQANQFWQNRWQIFDDSLFISLNGDTFNLHSDTLDVPFSKIWHVKPEQRVVLLSAENIPGLHGQAVVVVDQDTNVVDADTLYFKRTRRFGRRRLAENNWRLFRISGNQYRVQTETSPGVWQNRGRFIGRPDRFMRGEAFRANPDSLRNAAKRQGRSRKP